MKKIISSLILCCGLGLLSCEDFLTKYPHDAPTYDVYWKTESDVNSGVNGMYWLFRDVIMAGQGGRVLTYGDQPVGMWNNKSAIGQHPSQGTYNYAFNDSYLTDWSVYYKAINVSNVVINTVPTLSWDVFADNEKDGILERNIYIGEALFVRSYLYFFMVRLWGEVPYITTAINDASQSEKNVPLETEENILNNCLNDLKTAYDYLSWEDTHGGRATKADRGAVLALKAHILMWKNRKNKSNIDPQNYRDAIAAMDEIISNPKYRLQDIDDYLKIWNGGKSAESIFEFYYSRGNGEKFDKYSIFSNLLGYPMNPEREIESVYKYEQPFLDIIDKYTADGDQRRLICWDRWGEPMFQYTKKYSNITYLDVDKNNWELDNSFVLFRLSDMYLLRAEAYCDLGEYEKAREDLKTIQTRAGINETISMSIPDNKLSSEICEERMRELYLEGHNLYDWIRSGEYVGRNGYTADRYRQEGYLWPVYSGILIDNNYARQTPYWTDKLQ